MEQALAELNQKIDALTAQVAYLADQAQLAERQREDRSELMRDLTPIADQAYHMAITQLEEVQEYIDLGDLLRLLKRLARNGRTGSLCRCVGFLSAAKRREVHRDAAFHDRPVKEPFCER